MNSKRKKEERKVRILFGLCLVTILAVITVAVFLITGGIRQNDSKDTASENMGHTQAMADPDPDTESQQESESLEQYVPEGYVVSNDTVWTTTKVNVRAEANTDSEILGVLERRIQVTRIAFSEEWAFVDYEGQLAFVSQKYLTTEEPQDNGHVVVIDAGHQAKGNSATEPNAPGSSTMKAKVTGGTRGTTTGVYEYELNLDIALQLQEELENRGYVVYMTRTSHDVDISNVERAQYAETVGGDIFVRIHANGADSSSVSGALALAPSSRNAYVGTIASECQRLSKCVLDAYCSATGMKNQGVVSSDTMTGINWCTMPVTIMEMGYMTNPSDDTNMQDDSFQVKMVQGMADGIDTYFGEGE